MNFKRDCKSFREDYACEIMTAESQKDCTDCMFYEKISKKILLIKLGAYGDVVRTTPLLPALKKKYGHDCHITWLTEEKCVDLLGKNPDIDKVLHLNSENVERLKQEKFDVLISLEIEAKATLIASKVKANEKYGYYFHEDGSPNFFNQAAEYYLDRAFSDYVSKNNKKNYQEMIFEIAEVPYNKELCNVYNINKNYLNKFIEENDIKETDKIVCMNLGSSSRWPSKAWHNDNIVELAKELNEKNYRIMLRGGGEEEKLIEELKTRLSNENISVIVNDPTPTEISQPVQIITLISICDLVITGDTLGLHVAAALNKKTIALFFCTPPWEIEDYGIIKKLTSPLLEKHFFTDLYDEELIKSIKVEEVSEAINELSKTKVVNALIKKDDKFLIVKRKSNSKIHPSLWMFPGGKIENGETEEKALRREIKEETNLDVSDLKKISEYEYERDDKSLTSGKCFLTTQISSEIKLNEELDDFKWITKEEFKNYERLEELDKEVEKAFSSE